MYKQMERMEGFTDPRKHALLGIWVEGKGKLLDPETNQTKETVHTHSPTAGEKGIAEQAPTLEVFWESN